MNIETVYTAAMTKQAGGLSMLGKLWGGLKGTPGWIAKHPKISSGIGVLLAAFGLGTIGGCREGRAQVAQEQQPGPPDPVIESFKKFPNMGKQNWINTAVGAGVGTAAGLGLNEALRSVPGLKKRKLLRATLATLGGGGAGYLAWRASDNYQTNTNNNKPA